MKDLDKDIYILVIDVGAAANLSVDIADIFSDVLAPSSASDNRRVDPVEYELMMNGKFVHFSFLSWVGPSSETLRSRLVNLIRGLEGTFDGFVVLRDSESTPAENRLFLPVFESLKGFVVFTSVQLSKDRPNVVRELRAAISDEVAEVSRKRKR